MPYDFDEKTVVITGGSEGVGAATARRFAATGANLVLVARTKRNLDLVADELRGQARVLTIAMDVADPDACLNMLKKASFEFGGVHVLVNNAACHARGAVLDQEPADLGRMIDVNLRAPIVLSRLAAPKIQESGGGAIINVASLAGCTPTPGAAVYSASKFGLRAFTFAFADELRGTGVKIAVVSPGPIDTGFIKSDIDNVTDLTFSQPICSAEQVAEQILRLCSGSRLEQAMPALSGMLATLGYVFPALRRLAIPYLQRRGRRIKRRWKAEMRTPVQSAKKE